MSTDRIAAQFADFHAQHPWVYDRLKDLALSLHRAGVDHYGISGLYETLRYQVVLGTKDEEGFKLNNNYRALYAREIAKREPELADFFKFRMRKPHFNQYLSPEVDAWDNHVQGF